MKLWLNASEKECGIDMSKEKVVRCKSVMIRPDLVEWIC